MYGYDPLVVQLALTQAVIDAAGVEGWTPSVPYNAAKAAEDIPYADAFVAVAPMDLSEPAQSEVAREIDTLLEVADQRGIPCVVLTNSLESSYQHRSDIAAEQIEVHGVEALVTELGVWLGGLSVARMKTQMYAHPEVDNW
jgi:hypothetical protein